MPRGLILLKWDESGEPYTDEIHADIALARCPLCGTRPRVLPYDVLPYKQYSLVVITELVTTYASWGRSLREVVWDLLGERTPSHATLHGWTEGLGAHVLGMPGAEADGAPFSRFVFEAQAHMAPVAQVVQTQFFVDECRYRSEARRERLAGVAMLIAMAAMVAGKLGANMLARCRSLALVWSGSCVLVFDSRFICTPIEQVGRAHQSESGSPQPRSRDPCQTHTKLPPGASNKSHP